MKLEQHHVRQLIEQWFVAFQGADPAALCRLITLPFTFSRHGVLSVLCNEAEFSAWWTNYVAQIRSDGKVARGEILKVKVEPISATAALARLQSARLDSNDNVVAIVTTAFVIYHVDGGWKVGGSVADATMNVEEAELGLVG